MSDRERSSPTLIESGLKNLIGGRDSNYPLISGINGKYQIYAYNINDNFDIWIESRMRLFLKKLTFCLVFNSEFEYPV